MSHVTISDHNTIDGALEIAHLPDTFISEEVTTYFPDDGCKVHVLAININETQHADISNIRKNIYELAKYLIKENILSIVAHPLYAINDKLTLAHFEQMLLLFQNFELNGARNSRENECLRLVMEQLNQDTFNRMAETHTIEPLFSKPWQKKLWGGSDDHSSLNIARSFTIINDGNNPKILKGDRIFSDLDVISHPATPMTMGHNLYGIAYQYYRSKFDLGRYTDKDVLMRFLDRNLSSDHDSHLGLFSKLHLRRQSRRDKKVKKTVSDSLITLLRHETSKMIQEDPEFYEPKKRSPSFNHQEQRWYDFAKRSSTRIMVHFCNHLLDHISGFNFFNIFSTMGSAGGLYTLLAPYFVAFSQFAKDRAFSENVGKHFQIESLLSKNGDTQVAHFTDTFYEVNGVAKSLQQQVHYALKNNKAYTLITCHNIKNNNQPGVRNFIPVGTYELPEYPEQKIFFPPFLEILNYCYDNNIGHIHTATPGPVGLAALAIAKILKVYISGTYHTAIPEYAKILTGDQTIEELSWKYVLWYYDQLDVIYAPSKSTKDQLVSKGLNSAKIKLYPRGIDVKFYHPAKRNGFFKATYDIPEGIKLLYVGRVSKEKNLNMLIGAFKRLISNGEKAQLIIVGDGPYLENMKEEMRGFPCYFTGYLTGETLATVYASSDIFVFPSTTDTFGNVVLEAQASGLPVIVSDVGGPCENILKNRTGFIYRGNDLESIFNAMMTLIRDPQLRQSMGQEARRYVEERSFENAFLQTWKLKDEDRAMFFQEPSKSYAE
jgi:glycosyltransferase involved in cell wall biosynthesis